MKTCFKGFSGVLALVLILALAVLALVLASLACCLAWALVTLVLVSVGLVWVLGLVGSAAVAWGRDLAVILVMLTLDFCDIDFLSLVTKKV